MDVGKSVELEIVEVLRETVKARQVKLPCGIYWIPISQSRIINKKIYIPKWLADQKGIDYLACDIVE